jgi:hypothetical protein
MRNLMHCFSKIYIMQPGVKNIIKLALLVVFTFSLNFSQAQAVKVHGGFLSDSIKIGEQTAYYLSARYPSNLTVLFPDSAFSFTPFEYQKKNYFATKTEDTTSLDSAVYYLTSFEVDRIQYLDLPVYVVNPQDCTIYESPQDNIMITQLVARVPDSVSVEKLPLKMNTAYQKVFFQFNYWVVIIIVGILLILVIVAWIIFGKRIRKYFKTKKLLKRHSQFLQSYNASVDQIKAAFSPVQTESTLSMWKKYMEDLEARPYTKLTTRETFTINPDESLKQNLSMVDKAIYGHDTAVIDSLESLKIFADQRFSRKLEEVKHG